MICSYIDEHKEQFGFRPICEILHAAGVQIAPSTYYARIHRPPSARQIRDKVVKKEISTVHAANYDAFGAKNIHVVLNREPDYHGRGHVARCTVERPMKEMGLHGTRRAKAPNTTRSRPREQCPADLVDRHFAAFAPDQLWVADITYVHTFSGWVYVAFVTDVFNREIVGWYLVHCIPIWLWPRYGWGSTSAAAMARICLGWSTTVCRGFR